MQLNQSRPKINSCGNRAGRSSLPRESSARPAEGRAQEGELRWAQRRGTRGARTSADAEARRGKSPTKLEPENAVETQPDLFVLSSALGDCHQVLLDQGEWSRDAVYERRSSSATAPGYRTHWHWSSNTRKIDHYCIPKSKFLTRNRTKIYRICICGGCEQNRLFPPKTKNEFFYGFERIVHRQLTDYLDSYNLLDPLQSGFRPNHSTSTALLKITEDAREAMDRREVTVLSLLDFSRAFETIDIDILIAKLKMLHLSDTAIMWMESYLRDRHQCVSHKNRFSSWRDVKAGIPQGSVLGPPFFTIYINDISTALKHCQHHLYADDLQIYIHSRPTSLNDSLSKLNHDLTLISSWARKCGLNLNPGKTQVILLGHQRLQSSININTLLPVTLNNTIIPFSTTVKNLGFHFDSSLSWNAQVKYVCKKTFSILHSLKRLKNLFPSKLKQILIQTLVMPYFDYCDVLYSDLSVELSLRLQRVHNACVRFIFNSRRYDHVSEYFLQLSWLRLRERRSVDSLCLLYQILNNSTPIYLVPRFTLLASHHNRDTRSQHNHVLSIPLHQTSLYSASFTIHTARSWNYLSQEIRSSRSLKSFKYTLLRNVFNE
ncbi:hypothetical protein ANN_06782 [Periplaneta americana]|uniref:Reverse transcriptase domain-containing protein n=1 Tax=Periplaneta americana TaxID=6978 RepID=A0ABQ8TFD1_PERAM|nr:hypothetical protein ANN_06782 [Periplaneta americana]